MWHCQYIKITMEGQRRPRESRFAADRDTVYTCDTAVTVTRHTREQEGSQ